jgi:hypothetical protein
MKACLMYLVRVGRNGFVWTNHVLPRDAGLSRDGGLADCSGGACDLFHPSVSIPTVYSRLLEW